MFIGTTQEIFNYNGLIDSLNVVEILSDIEAEAGARGVNSSLRKKIFSIAVEALQNLYHHTRDFSIPGKKDKKIRQIQFRLSEDSDHFYIETSNYLLENQVKIVEEKIKFVNHLSEEKLKEFHRKILTNNEISGKGGAGLGFIDMRRKSGFDLNYKVEKLEYNIARFTFRVKIIKKKENRMKELILNGTKKTPYINFDASTGKLELSGRSIPENSFEFYNPLLEWLSEYKAIALPETNVKIYLEYFNTSSSKYILEVLKKLRDINKLDGKEVKVEWCYDEDDEEMKETGEDYEDVTGFEFIYTEIGE